MFPTIKPALVDVCHEIGMCDTTILKSYGELGLGRPQGWPHEPTCLVSIRSPQNSALLPPNLTPFGRPLPAGQSSNLPTVRIGG